MHERLKGYHCSFSLENRCRGVARGRGVAIWRKQGVRGVKVDILLRKRLMLVRQGDLRDRRQFFDRRRGDQASLRKEGNVPGGQALAPARFVVVDKEEDVLLLKLHGIPHGKEGDGGFGP